MPPIAPQPVQITCPACGTPFRAGIFTLVDVSQQPELKAALLGGQLNVAVCPNCRTPTMLGAPMIYHDAAKQLLLVYFPQELNSSPQDQERFVGEATSFLMRSLPAETPKGYLLAPKRFLTLPSLLDAVLEADGISREVLQRQRAHVDLISQLAERLPDAEDFAGIVEERRAEMTPEFLATLAAFIEATPPDQDESRAILAELQERLLDQLGEQPDAEAPSDAEVEAAIEAIAAASDDELELAVAENRELLDYGFFEAWTARIEAAEPAEAERLTARRARILEIVEELDKKAQEMFEAGSVVLREVLEAEDPRAALDARADRVDEAFLMVLSANAAAAQRAGRDDLVAIFEQLSDAAVEIIQSRLTPEERFINELLMLETPQEATKILRKSVAKITPALVKRLNELADQEEKRSNKPIADRLRQLARECGAMLF